MKSILFTLLASLFVFSSTAFAGGFLDYEPTPTCQAVRGGYHAMSMCDSQKTAEACSMKKRCTWTTSTYRCRNYDMDEVSTFDCSAQDTPRQCRAGAVSRYCTWATSSFNY